MTKKAINIVWFKRDLRLVDNEALYHANQSDLPLLLIYVFEPSVMNYDDSDVRHWRFIYESIQDLNKKLAPFNAEIYFFHNEVKSVFSEIINKFEVCSPDTHSLLIRKTMEAVESRNESIKKQ